MSLKRWASGQVRRCTDPDQPFAQRVVDLVRLHHAAHRGTDPAWLPAVAPFMHARIAAGLLVQRPQRESRVEGVLRAFEFGLAQLAGVFARFIQG